MTTILIVEDNDLNLDMLSRRLVQRGFDIIAARDGLQGVRLAVEQKPDLVLMDMSLPGIDGWEATRRIKATAECGDIPILGLSAHALTGDRGRALEAGCDDYDTKPVDFARLLAKIADLTSTGGPNSGRQ